jgi:acyl carrier protein
MIEMLMSLEENFGVSVPDDQVASLKTVNDIVAFIQNEKKDAE